MLRFIKKDPLFLFKISVYLVDILNFIIGSDVFNERRYTN